jgi:hypothetical protein
MGEKEKKLQQRSRKGKTDKAGLRIKFREHQKVRMHNKT